MFYMFLVVYPFSSRKTVKRVGRREHNFSIFIIRTPEHTDTCVFEIII